MEMEVEEQDTSEPALAPPTSAAGDGKRDNRAKGSKQARCLGCGKGSNLVKGRHMGKGFLLVNTNMHNNPWLEAGKGIGPYPGRT